jgi:hypothetical protein
MWNFNWVPSPYEISRRPFRHRPQPLVLEGPAPSLVEAMKHPDTLIWFPICWQACLIGSLHGFDEGTDEAHPTLLAHVRGLYKRPASGYVISPQKLD